MNGLAAGLATFATTGAALLVLLVYAPSLQAPFLVPKFAVLELGAALGLVAFGLGRAASGRPRWRRTMTAGTWAVLATTAIAWIGAARAPAGAPYAVAALARWGTIFGLACGASVLAGDRDAGGGPYRMTAALTVAAAAVAAIGLLQHVGLLPFGIPVISTPGSTFGNRNAAAEVMAVALPLGLGAVAEAPRRSARAALGAALAIELVYLAVTRTRGAWIAAGCAIGVTLFLERKRWSRASLAWALGALLVASAAAAVPGRFNPRDAGDSKRYSGVVQVLEEGLDTHSTALRTRFGLWRRTLAMVRDHPILGVGPGNWPVEFPRYAEPGAARDGVLSATLAPRQAHDDLLERTAETGLIGLAAFALLVFAAASAVRERLRSGGEASRSIAAAAGGALVSVVVLGLASFPLEEPGTLLLAGLSLGLVADDPRAQTPAPARGASVQESDSPVESLREIASVPGEPGASVQASGPPEENGTRDGDVSLRPAPRWHAYATALVGLALAFGAARRADRSIASNRWLGKAERAMRRDPGLAGASLAIDALTRALQAEPDDYRTLLRMAQMKLRQRRTADSARAARRAIALEPYSPNGWAALAAAELEGGDPRTARQDASNALAILRDYPFALQLRARAAERQGDPSAAEADHSHLEALAAGRGDTARAASLLLEAHP